MLLEISCPVGRIFAKITTTDIQMSAIITECSQLNCYTTARKVRLSLAEIACNSFVQKLMFDCAGYI